MVLFDHSLNLTIFFFRKLCSQKAVLRNESRTVLSLFLTLFSTLLLSSTKTLLMRNLIQHAKNAKLSTAPGYILCFYTYSDSDSLTFDPHPVSVTFNGDLGTSSATFDLVVTMTSSSESTTWM